MAKLEASASWGYVCADLDTRGRVGLAFGFDFCLGFGFGAGKLVLALGVGELVIVVACLEGDFGQDDAGGFFGSVGRSS